MKEQKLVPVTSVINLATLTILTEMISESEVSLILSDFLRISRLSSSETNLYKQNKENLKLEHKISPFDQNKQNKTKELKPTQLNARHR